MTAPCTPFFNRSGGFGITGSPSAGWTLNKTAQASTTEEIARFGTSDAVGYFSIRNNSTADGAFVANLYAFQSGATLRAQQTSATGSDTGAVPVWIFDSRQSNNTAITTRPLFAWANNAADVMKLSAAGGLAITGGTTPSLTVGASGTAITQMRVYSQALDPASVAANTTAEQTFTVTGLTTADKVFVNKPSNTAGLGIVNARVSAADTLAITFGNFTAGAIDAASETYTITAIRS